MIRGHLAEYRLFPYERDLAVRELAALAAAPAEMKADDVVLFTDSSASTRILQRATYLNSITVENVRTATEQARIEERHWFLRNGRTLNKQATRYGLHGIHEYRGKFNPQMARALLNISDPDATNLLDPFCGSGTTLLEGARFGMTVSGIDRSPIARFLALTKLRAASEADPEELLRRFRIVRTEVRDALKVGQEVVNLGPPEWMSDTSAKYLREWFTKPALSALYLALKQLDQPGESLVGDLAAVAVSSILRNVSLQLPEDLRVRRRPSDFVAPPLAEAFDVAAARTEVALEELSSAVLTRIPVGDVRLGSCADRQLVGAMQTGSGRRLIVTSPPYATALPYIDTDRLSLVLLGLTQPAELRVTEASLVGSREWLRGEASKWTLERPTNAASLPDSVLALTQRIADQNARTGAGFRRAAVPALLYRYFADMGACIGAWTSYLRRGERAVLVVGRNRTGPKGYEIPIDTPRLLGEVAETRGFELTELIPFETWPRYGLHGSNGVQGEDAVLLTRTA